MCSSFKQLVLFVLIITAPLLLGACVNSAQASPQRVSLTNPTRSILPAEFTTPTLLETPNPIPPPTTVPTEAPAAPVPASPENNKGSLVERFLNGDLPKEEDLFVDGLGKNHFPLGYTEIHERTDVLEKRANIQVYLLDAENIGTSSVILVGTIDPRTNERAVVPVLIGDQSTQYLNTVYWWVDPGQKPYFSDKDDVRPELKNAAELVDLIKAEELGQTARINFSLEEFEDQMRAKGAPGQIIAEYISFFFPHIEANNRLVTEPSSLQNDIGVTGDLSTLNESQLAKMPRTFGIIKVWGDSTSSASNNFGTSTLDPIREPTPVDTPTSEAVPTTALTESPAVPSNPGNEALIGPDGKLRPIIPLKFLGFGEQAPNWGKMPMKADGTVVTGIVTPFEPVFGINLGGFSGVVERTAFEENGHTYLGIITQDPSGKISHIRLRIDEFEGSTLTGYSDAIGGVWTPNPALSPAFKKTDSFRSVDLWKIKDNFAFGDQLAISFGDVRSAGVPNLTLAQLELVTQSGNEFGEQNSKLINGELAFSDGMEIGTVISIIDTSPHPTPPPTEPPLATANEPSMQPGETDYPKMGQEELKKIAESSVRMIKSSGRGEYLPLTVRVDKASESGVVNYFVGAIVLDGAKSVEMTTPGLPDIDGNSNYTFKATLIPILLQNSAGQYMVTQILLPENYIVNYTIEASHIEPDGSTGTLKTTPRQLLSDLKPNIQHRFDLITKVNPSEYTDRLKTFPDNPETPFNDAEGIKTRFSLVSNFGQRTEEFFDKFEAGDLEGVKQIPWIGPAIGVRVNTP